MRGVRIACTVLVQGGSSGAENKTRKNHASVSEFLNAIGDDRKRKAARAVAKIMKRVTSVRPRMWGTSISRFSNN
jgi:hypothetical protein